MQRLANRLWASYLTRMHEVSAKAMLCSLVVILSACGGSGGGALGADDNSGSVAQSAGGTLSVSGEVRVVNTFEQDLDRQVSGQSSLNLLNNTIFDAQRLNNPTSVGGYVSRYSGHYSNGISYARDGVDVYSIPLLKDQVVRVFVEDADEYSLEDVGINQDSREPMDIGFDLFSADDAHVPLLSTRFFSPGLRELIVPEDGEYLFKLSAKSFGSTPAIYQIEASAELASGLTLNYRYSDLASGRVAVSSGVDGDYVYAGNHASSSDLTKLQAVREVSAINQANGSMAEPDFLAESTSVDVNDTWRLAQWNLDQIKVPQAWDSASGQGVRVAVIDSGVDAYHPDLLGRIALDEGYDFISNPNNGDGDGRDSDASEVVGGSYHGTHISGVIAANANNAEGLAGIAYDAEIIPLRVIDQSGQGSSLDIAQAILYAAGLTNLSGQILSPKADVINLSLGFMGNSAEVSSAVQRASAAGVIIIAAAGNNESNAAFYPAAFPEVVGVGAINSEGFRSLFSNYGNNVSLMAPGGTDPRSYYYDLVDDDIIGPGHNDGYVGFIGTSFAAPHVAAIAALMKEAKPELDGAEFNALLNGGLLTDAQANSEFYGRGILNAEKALASVGGAVADALSVFPNALSLSVAERSRVIQLSNFGSGNLTVESVSASESWLEVSQLSSLISGLGQYQVSLSESISDNQTEQALINIKYRINGGVLLSETIPVFKQESQTVSLTEDVYVYLVSRSEAENANVEPHVEHVLKIDAFYGAQRFEFLDVEPGEYYLEASTDNDGDGFVFDRGEAVGAYRFSAGEPSFNLQNRVDDAVLELSYQRLYEQIDYAAQSNPQLGRRL